MPTVVSNANIYLNGNNFVGKAKEVELPEIEPTLEEHEAMGLYGSPEFPVGIEPMEATITWASFYPEWARAAADFFSSVDIQCRASVEDHQTNGRVATQPLIVQMRAIFKKNPLGKYTQKEMAEYESELSVSYVKQTYGREVILEFDALNNIYKVGGVDRLADFRRNLAL